MLPTLLVATLVTLALTAQAAPPPPKVLLVVSSEGRDPDGKEGKTRPGFEIEEFAQAWLVLRANGLQVDVASPAGGAVLADRHNPKADLVTALNVQAEARQQLQATRRTADVKAGEHDAIFVIGGKGAMFDLPRDAALQRLIAQQHERGAVLAAVCHGPAAFASVKLANGQPLVAGRRLTGFTDEEETQFGKRWAKEYPFWLEQRLREQGAVWEEAPLMMPKVVVDGRLVTGQNPFSTAATAEAVVRALGREPVTRAVFKEEISMQLVQRWLAGEHEHVRAMLRTDTARYKTDLIAMLGYYQFDAASDDTVRRQALSIMELAAPYMQHPQLKLGIANAHARLGNLAHAKQLLQALLAEKPDYAPAQQALAKL
jgi:putative intracellular protease/amidase